MPWDRHYECQVFSHYWMTYANYSGDMSQHLSEAWIKRIRLDIRYQGEPLRVIDHGPHFESQPHDCSRGCYVLYGVYMGGVVIAPPNGCWTNVRWGPQRIKQKEFGASHAL